MSQPRGEEAVVPAGDDKSLVSIVVPALNEAQSLNELYSRIKAVFVEINRPFEFVLVDDGSSDDTREVAAALCRDNDNVIVIHHMRRYGKSIALMQGFDAANGDVGITMDADLQDQPEMIPRLLDKLDEGYDLVNAYRYNRHDKSSRRFVSKLYNGFVSWVFNSDIKDVNCGLKALRRPVYKSLELYGDLHRLIPVIAELKAFKTIEVPVEHKDRKHGQSRYRLLRHRGFLDIVVLFIMNASESRPFHFFSELAFIFWSLAALCLFGWIGVVFATTPDSGHAIRIAGTLLGGIGTWAGFVGTILPLFGFFLEFEARRLQNAEWRLRLVKDTQRSGEV